MNTSKRLMLALVAAFGMSALFTFFLSRRVSHVSASEHTKMQPYQSPKRDIAAGEVLHPEDLQTIYWPTNKRVDGALVKQAETINRVTLYPLAPGQPILDRDLAIAGSGTGLASKIPPGMRAIALKSDEVVGVAGFLNPGSYVDLLMTSKASFGSDPVTATVLQNAEVVAVGQQTEPSPDGKPTKTTVVTLLLDPQQAERALLASNQGSLQFALRNGADKNIAHNAPVLMSEIAPQTASKSMFGGTSMASLKPQSPLASASALPGATPLSGRTTLHATTKANAVPGRMEVVYGSGKSNSGMGGMAPGAGAGGGIPSGSASPSLPASGGMASPTNEAPASAAAPAMGVR